MQDDCRATQEADYRRFFTSGRTLALALGYGLFRGANSLLYSSALATAPAPALFIADMSFSMITSLAAFLFALVLMILAWKGLVPDFRLPVVIPALLLVLVASSAAPWIAQESSGMLVALALTYGAASTCLNLSWLEMVAHQTPARIAGVLALSMLIKSVITLICGSLTGLLFVFSVGALLLGGVLMLLRARSNAWLDSCNEHAAPREFPVYRQGLMGIADALVVSIVLEATVSILNGFFLAVAVADGSGIVSALGSIFAALVFCFVVVVVARAVDVERLYRYLFPILLALVVLLPLTLGSFASLALQSLLVLVYEFISFSALYFILCQIQYKKLKTYVLFAFVTACIRLSQLLFGMVGYWLGGVSGSEAEGLYWIVVIATVYALSMLLLYLTRRRPSSGEKHIVVVTEEDRYAARAKELAGEYRITARESEIMLQLARGRSAAFIAEELVCSPATVRTHMKSIYAKLGVHSKQQLIDLFAE